MSPLQGCEKPSLVRMIIHYTYQYLDSGTTHPSGVQHALCNMQVRGIVAPYLSEIGNTARTPQITEVRNLSMQCVRYFGIGCWYEARRDPAHNFWVSMHRNPEGCLKRHVGRVSVGRRHKSLTQCQIAKSVWWGINIYMVLLYCDKALISLRDVRRSNYWTNDKQDV
jgi:hypothetical protein